jgi:hypothetical protein
MIETIADAVLLTTDTDLRVYRRHGRQVIPCVLPRRGGGQVSTRGGV